ncbi:MAG TPA: fumarylacetoacetate hydrolase family protein [Polyangiaceae bacterium]|nr:fumarylacetoacetate hydrolase family protein [Polyangiaceae bacterium]
MNDRVSRGVAAHLKNFEDATRDGARLGWKVAFNVPAVQERLGLTGSLIAGLTRRTGHESGVFHSLTGASRPALEAEVAVWLGSDVAPDVTETDAASAVVAWAPAIELVDFNRPFEELEAIITEGVFHRAVVFGERNPVTPGADLAGRAVRVDYGGEILCEVDARVATGHAPAILQHLARLLAPYGHRLAAGDVIILGSMNPFTVAEPGRAFSVSIAGIGATSVLLVP